jgi:hypothetical protein
MDISVETLQGFLDDAWDAAPAAANTLRQQFRSFESAASSQFNTVGTLSSVAKNSASQSYRGPGLGSLTLVQIQTAWRMLIRLYDSIKCQTDWFYNQAAAWFIQKYPTYGNDPDQAVYDFSMRWLNSDFTQYESDLSWLRLSPTLGPIPGIEIA